MPKTDFTFKIILLGEAGAGKTSLSERYITGAFSPEVKMTVGVDFYVKTLKIDNLIIKLQIWDLGGEARFRFLLPTYCLGSSSAIFIYDVTRPRTLDYVNDWISIVREKNGQLPVFLIGNKIDLEKERKITTQYGEKTAEVHKATEFMEVSAKSGYRVEELFEKLTNHMMSRFKKIK